MAISNTQKASAKALVAVFETGRLPTVRGYATVTNIPGDTGGLTYGIHQVTINSGNLYLMLVAYTETAGARFADSLRPYLGRVLAKERGLAGDAAFTGLLRRAGLEDVVMREAQEAFFDRVFWTRAATICARFGFTRALSHAVVYDSCIHGSWQRIADATTAKSGSPSALGETAWTRAYVEARFDWLANNGNTVLRTTVYRQRAFRALFENNKWDLDLPFTVALERNKKGGGTTFEAPIRFTAEALGLSPAADPEPETVPAQPERDSVSAETGTELDRLLYVPKNGDPLLRGPDVEAVQGALAKLGYATLGKDGKADGVYGPLTAEAVRLFQKKNGMRADAVVGNATLAKLDIK